MQCDICGSPGQGMIVHPELMKKAVLKGFNPFTLGLLPAHMLALASPESAERWAQSATYGESSRSPWNVCPRCLMTLVSYQ